MNGSGCSSSHERPIQLSLTVNSSVSLGREAKLEQACSGAFVLTHFCFVWYPELLLS